MFSMQLRGYKTTEVDAYITKMKESLSKKDKEIAALREKIDNLSNREGSVSVALTAAVEKAKEIENSSKSVYDFKIQQLSILYSRWEMLLNEMLLKHPDLEDVTNIKNEMEKFKEAVRKAVKEDFDISMSQPLTNDPMRTLLNRVKTIKENSIQQQDKSTLKNVVKSSENKVKIERNNATVTTKTELTKLEEKTTIIKPISDVIVDNMDKYDNAVDKFLNDDDLNINNAYIKKLVKSTSPNIILPNETGFNLKEAVNPKDDLEEIMKAFDFYDSEDDSSDI